MNGAHLTAILMQGDPKEKMARHPRPRRQNLHCRDEFGETQVPLPPGVRDSPDLESQNSSTKCHMRRRKKYIIVQKYYHSGPINLKAGSAKVNYNDMATERMSKHNYSL
jgi:hypothetical protein